MFYTLHVVEPLRYDSVLIKETNEWMMILSLVECWDLSLYLRLILLIGGQAYSACLIGSLFGCHGHCRNGFDFFKESEWICFQLVLRLVIFDFDLTSLLTVWFDFH